MKKRRFGLRTKFTILFLLFAAIIMVSVGIMTYQSYRESMMKKYADEAISIAKLAASYLDGDEIARYAETREKDAEYERLKKILDNIKQQTGVLYLYVVSPVSDDSTVYIFDAAFEEEQNYLADLGERGDWDDNFKLAKEAYATGKPSEGLEPTMTQLGYLASAYVPIQDSSGKSVAVVGVDFTMDEIQSFLEDSIRNLLVLMAAVIGFCFLLLLLLMNRGILSPIRVLKDKVERMSKGELGVQVPIRSKDEIGEISEVFNRMSYNIGGHIQEVTELNEGYFKFVPSVLFELLGKKSIREIRLGDHQRVPLEVLSMQVNGFEERTRKMSSRELFDYVNQIYKLCIPLIMEQKGVVDSFFNGGLNAIYGNAQKNALDSAISICQAVGQRENGGEQAGPDLAFGISRGDVLVGVVGHDKRLAAATMSEQISMIGYLRKIAGKYNARILITETAAQAIPDFQERYHARMLGLLHRSASDSLEKIYDVFDGDRRELRELKERTKAVFEKGVRYFTERNFYEARRCFIEVLKVSQSDYAAREYLYLCSQYYTKEDTSETDIYIEAF